jgi:hypothetical protein
MFQNRYLPVAAIGGEILLYQSLNQDFYGPSKSKEYLYPAPVFKVTQSFHSFKVLGLFVKSGMKGDIINNISVNLGTKLDSQKSIKSFIRYVGVLKMDNECERKRRGTLCMVRKYKKTLAD